MSQPIIILDTTLRDGEQTPGVSLNLSEKLEIAKRLERLGVDIIEAGFPASSPGDFEAVRAVSQELGCKIAALCRCHPDDVEKGWNALKYAVNPRLHLFIASSDIHLKYKLGMTREEVLRRTAESVTFAKSLCADVQFSCEDATRSDPGYLCELFATAIAAGASTINIPDTVGYTTPAEFSELIGNVFANVPNIDKAVVSVHCHDDLGLAVANTLAGLQAGAKQIETTINGLGERAGNCAMEEVIMGLTVREAKYGLSHSIDTTRIHRTSQRVSKITGVPVPVNKAIVGANAFAHESGIHQHGVLKNPMTYEIMTPQAIGKTENTMVLGKLSGRHAFSDRLQSMGYSLTAAEIDTAFAEFKELADRKKLISDEDLEAIVSHSLADAPDYFRVDSFQIQSGNRMCAMASINLVHDEDAFTEAAIGDGPIDAAYNAINRIVKGDWLLEDYGIKAVTGGMDALGEVTVRVRHGKALHVGRGLSTDIIEASILAYINAINRALALQSKAE